MVLKMKWIKSLSVVLCVCLLLSPTGCSDSPENSDVPTDGLESLSAENSTSTEDQKSLENVSSNSSKSNPTEPTAGSSKPPMNNAPIVTAEELLELFYPIENEKGPLILTQNLTYKRMVDVMGFDYQELPLEDGTLTYKYLCSDGAIVFHYNQDNGPFDYIALQCSDHVYEFSDDFNSTMSYGEVTAKIDEYVQEGLYYGYYGALDDESKISMATWITLDYAIEWQYLNSNLSRPSGIQIWNSNMWAYTSDPFGWPYELVTKENIIGEFNYNQYIENTEVGANNTSDGYSGNETYRTYTDEQIAQVALNDFHNKIVSDLRQTMSNPPSYLGILDGCTAEGYTVSFEGYSNTYSIVLNARYGTNVLDMGFTGGSSRYVVNATYQDTGNGLICTSFSYS